MAVVNLVLPEINDEFPFAPGALAVVAVEASLTGNGSTPQDWTLKAAILTYPGDILVEEQYLTNTMGTSWTGSVNAGALSTGKPNYNNYQVRVTAEKSAGGAGAALGQIKCWIDDPGTSCSSDSSDSSEYSETKKPKGKSKSPLLVTKAKAAMAKTAAKPPVKSAKKTLPAKKPALAKKPAKKK